MILKYLVIYFNNKYNIFTDKDYNHKSFLMKEIKIDIQRFLNFQKEKGGTANGFNFKFLEYKVGYLKLEGEFSSKNLNPNKSVQGGQMNSMLDDVTSLLLIYESRGLSYPSSTNLHSIHHRPLSVGKVIAIAETIKIGRKIATIKGELYSEDGLLSTTLIHTAVVIKANLDIPDLN